MNIFAIFALLAGAAIALQASMNAKLGILLNNSLLATSVAFFAAFTITLLSTLLVNKGYPSQALIKSVPFYLWFAGGLLAAFGVSTFYYLIPKMGVGQMMSYALTGQIIIAMVAGHFGWFELPIRTFDFNRLLGLFALIVGITLINWD